MKINENFVLKKIAGSTVVMPVGDAVNKVRGMIKLNSTAEIIWKALEKETDFQSVVDEVKKNCNNVDEASLTEDVTAFLEQLKKLEILED